ncbi:MAG TPA: GNAT family N-acetyltransferase [Polyangiaceae bacterium]|nr:GNAT family N-acetyltransferase [Polyangiaceae bacterium]
MGRNLEILKHGDERLWLLLGRFFCDRAVLKEMGGPLYSGPGVTWFVALARGKVVGFCSLRVTPTAYWHDYAYVVPEARKHGVHERLAATREKLQATLPPLPSRVAIPKRRWPRYQRRGWSIQSERGSWIYAVLVPQ